MATLPADGVLAASQQALAALQEQLDAARQGLEAVRAVRSAALAGPSDIEAAGSDVLQSVRSAAERAGVAMEALKQAHTSIMDVHYAARRGDEINLRGFSDLDQGAVQGEAAQDLEAHQGVSPTSGPTREEKLELKRQEFHARKWSLPEDAGAKRLAAAESAPSGSSAAAAAFAAAEKAAKKRSADRPDGTESGGASVGAWHRWHEAIDWRFEEDAKPQAMTKVVGGERSFDFSMFNRELWERAQARADSMLAEQEAGVFCWRESVPHPQSRIPGCMQVKVRHIQVNTEEKIVRAYQAMAAGGGLDRNGFILGASLGRFITLATDKSDHEAKSGGDCGWVTKGKLDPKIEEVAFCCPRGACSPPFRVKLASFHIVYVEDRR